MKAIFLSASVPDPRRDARYHTTADIIAIRDSIRALATVVLPHASLTWGGHPAITPLIRVVAESVGVTEGDRVRLYQSAWYSEVLPSDSAAFERYVLTPKMDTKDRSDRRMREQMLTEGTFDAAIFIGGMEGVEEEYQMFRQLYPRATTFPVASTGAAAALIYEREREVLRFPTELKDDFAYPTLFRRLLDLPSR